MTESERARSAVDQLPPDQTAESTAISWRSRRLKPVWWLAAVAVFFVALWGWTELRLRTLRAQIDENTAARAALEETIRRLRLDNQRLTETIHAFTAAESRSFSLTGQKAAPRASGRVFVEPNGRGHVYVHNLPNAPEDRIYHLWLVRTTSPQPHRLALFDVDAAGTAQISRGNFPPPAELRSVLITLEPRSGVTRPRGPRFLTSQ